MKELPTEFKKYTCKNDVLSGEDDENFYVYDGNQFVRTECKYGHHNDYFSQDVFIAAKMDKENSKYFQNATVLIEGKLYVCLYYASGEKEGRYFSECYCLYERNNK